MHILRRGELVCNDSNPPWPGTNRAKARLADGVSGEVTISISGEEYSASLIVVQTWLLWVRSTRYDLQSFCLSRKPGSA